MTRLGSVAAAASRLPQEAGPAVTGPWPLLRVVVDLVLVLIVTMVVMTMAPGEGAAESRWLMAVIGVCFGLAGLVSLRVGRYADEEELGGFWLLIERLIPLILVPTGAGLLLFPTAVAWGFLQLLLVSCCPLMALSRLGRVRALIRLQVGLALAGALVLDPGAAVVAPPFLLVLCVALALEHFGSAFAVLPDERPAHVATVVFAGAAVSMVVAQPAFLLARWLLPAWDRDLSGVPLTPDLSGQAEASVSLLEALVFFGLLILCWYLWKLLGAGSRAAGGSTKATDLEPMGTPDPVALSDTASRQWRASRRWDRAQAAVIDAWLALERALERRGAGRGRGEPPGLFAQRLASRLRGREDVSSAEAVETLASSFAGVRYGQQPPDPEQVRAARAASVAARRGLRRGPPPIRG